jgi:hypothetical protein
MRLNWMTRTLLALTLLGAVGSEVPAAHAADSSASTKKKKKPATRAKRSPTLARPREDGPAAAPQPARPAEAHPSDTRPSDTRPDAARPTEARPTDARPDAAHPDAAHPDAAHPDAARPTDARPADAHPTDAAPADARPDAVRPADAHPADARPASGTPGPRSGGAEPARIRHPEVERAPHAETAARHERAPYHSTDHRFARPNPYHVRAYAGAHHPPPPHYWYRPWYTHWYVHPYYRWTTATVAFVWFDYTVDAWADGWAPPPRPGWVWVPGHHEAGWWVPGHWAPVGPPPAVYGGGWVYVPGWWHGTSYVEGYWRAPTRTGSWAWVDGHYQADGDYVWGHWAPVGATPAGYSWEPGYWDGEEWVEGFWRPTLRSDYRWVSAWFDDDGVYHGGYWEPDEDRPGSVWIPGWFDGHEWIDGYWVPEDEYRAADPASYTPDPGWDDGWDAAKSVDHPAPYDTDEAPLALPVSGD